MSLLWVNAAARWVEHDDLPDDAKKAVHAYMLDGLDSDGFEDEHEMEEHKRNFHYHLEHVPTETLKQKIMASDTGEGHRDWDDYHKWYVNPSYSQEKDRNGLPRFRKHTERWPVIADDHHGGVIDDGWHRLHSYIAQGDKTIPVLHLRHKDGA